jgi:hypothetical protein
MSEKDSLLSQSMLLDIFEYQDGLLVYKRNKGRAKIGEAVCSRDNKGYRRAKIDGRHYFVHRLVFFMHHGYLPQFIDHIDCNRDNNRIENLREASATQNNRNRKIAGHNKSGVKGVFWVAKYQKWKAQCTVNYKQHHLGQFNRIEDAAEAVQQFRQAHHLEFARQI